MKAKHSEEILGKLNVPLGVEPKNFLKSFHSQNNSFGDNKNNFYPFIQYLQFPKPVVSEQIFATYYLQFKAKVDPNNSHVEVDENEQHHMKLIFQSYNEALNHYRPLGLKGQSLPWKVKSQRLVLQKVTINELERILSLAIAQVLKWGSYLCGFIPERIEGPNGEVIHIDEQYLAQIKEDRLAQMLENQVIENEQQWLQYDEEETEVELEISKRIFNDLIQEFIGQINPYSLSVQQMLEIERSNQKQQQIIENFKKSLSKPIAQNNGTSNLNTSF